MTSDAISTTGTVVGTRSTVGRTSTRPYSAEDVVRLRGTVKSNTPWPGWGPSGSGACCAPSLISAPSGADRRPGGADGSSRAEGDLRQRLASGRRHEYRRADLSRPKPLPGRQRADAWCGGSTMPCSGPTRLPTTRASREQMPYWYAPIVADAEAGFGGVLNAFELMKAMIEAGAAAVPLRGPDSSSSRNAATWAARCWCPPRRPSPSWWPPGWPPTCWTCPR